ncbi:MAG: hypothetical protein HUJ96_01990, partial [Marinilabiliaceae bacterium]|nr:hypothetical protein [Marinilabiliaceae bacterium]
HDKHKNILGILDDESEGENLLPITEKNLSDLLFAIREQNIKSEKSYELSEIPFGQATFKESFKINNKTFKNISVSLTSCSVYKLSNSSTKISDKIEPFEVSKENASKSGDVSGDFIKYTFHALKEEPDAPFEQQLSDVKLLELTIEEDDEWIFDVFLYNKHPQIQMTLTNIESDSLYTLSSYSVDNGALSGYILERPAGTAQEERTANSGMRIPEGTYNVCYPYNECNPITPRSNSINEFKLITSGQTDNYGAIIARDGILIHIGNYVWDATGCLLPGTTYQDYTLENDHEQRNFQITYTKGTTMRMVTQSSVALNEQMSPYVRKKKNDVDSLEIDGLTLQISITINR